MDHRLLPAHSPLRLSHCGPPYGFSLLESPGKGEMGNFPLAHGLGSGLLLWSLYLAVKYSISSGMDIGRTKDAGIGLAFHLFKQERNFSAGRRRMNKIISDI